MSVKKIEGPIRRKCQKFVNDKKDFGAGEKRRILELFEELAEEVVAAASVPAATLLVERFRGVDSEILAAFGEHSEPLAEAAEALIQRQERNVNREDIQLARAIESALSGMPSAQQNVA